MSTLSKSWATDVTLVQSVDYGGSAAVVAADQAFDYTDDVDLETSGYEGVQAQISYKGNNAKDDLVVNVFGSLDGSTYDTEPYEEFILDNDGTARRASIVIKDLAHFRLGFKSSDTNTEFAYQVTYQAWNTDNS